MKTKTTEVVMINNRSVVVDKEVADEIYKLREAIRNAKRFLAVPDECHVEKTCGVF